MCPEQSARHGLCALGFRTIRGSAIKTLAKPASGTSGPAWVIKRAAEVFRNAVAAVDWLNSTNAALGGVAPITLLHTDIGLQKVLDTLGRIERRVFA